MIQYFPFNTDGQKVKKKTHTRLFYLLCCDEESESLTNMYQFVLFRMIWHDSKVVDLLICYKLLFRSIFVDKRADWIVNPTLLNYLIYAWDYKLHEHLILGFHEYNTFSLARK